MFVLSPELGRSDKEITKILDVAVGKANNQGAATKSRLSQLRISITLHGIEIKSSKLWIPVNSILPPFSDTS